MQTADLNAIGRSEILFPYGVPLGKALSSRNNLFCPLRFAGDTLKGLELIYALAISVGKAASSLGTCNAR